MKAALLLAFALLPVPAATSAQREPRSPDQCEVALTAPGIFVRARGHITRWQDQGKDGITVWMNGERVVIWSTHGLSANDC